MTSTNLLPTSISRPLFIAALGVVVFLLFTLGWAVLAPLATTMGMTGQLVSSRPSFDLQHSYGGQIAEVFVARHHDVRRGQPLLQIDVTLERKNLRTFQAMKARIEEENRVISELLTEGFDGTRRDPSEIASHFLLRQARAQMERLAKIDATDSLSRQVEVLRGKVEQLSTQLDQMQARTERNGYLVEKGLMTRTADEALEEQALTVAAEIQSERAELFALEDQLAQTHRQAELIILSFREDLATTLDQNAKQLEELSLQIANLEDVIAKSEIVSPTDGVVTETYFEVGGMYAGRGQTLLSISEPLESPYVAFEIPTHLIDQLRPGMTGRFTIPGLPQRNLPQLTLAITAISPRAELDEHEAPKSYQGRAAIEPSSLEALLQVMGDDLTLSEDMPVDVLIEGRSTTMARYLFEPFAAAFRHALQD